jgi:hypothetical protein
VVTPTLGEFGLLYDVGFLVVAAVPITAIASCLRRSNSGENSFAETVRAVREDLNSDSSGDSDGDD